MRDWNQPYFMMSFRYNKTKPEEFGLTWQPQRGGLLMDADGALWRAAELYDFGWGREVGFIRQPELTFDELWDLLMRSDLEQNQYGAAIQLLDHHAEQVLQRVEGLLNDTLNVGIDDRTKKALLTLDLKTSVNRSRTVGKTIQQITDDLSRWRHVSEQLVRALRPC